MLFNFKGIKIFLKNKTSLDFNNHPCGFGLIEILIVVAIVAVIVPSMVAFSFFMTRAINTEMRQTEAVYIASEGIEAVYTLRNRGWDTEIASLSPGTTYYPVLAGGNWSLETTDPGLVLGRYTRTIVLNNVNRDNDDDIAVSGTMDALTRRVVSTVSWNEGDRTKNVTLETYLTDFLAN